VRRVSRIGVINISLFLFGLALLGRAAWVQLWEGQAWAARAVRQHFTDAPVPAPRGDILDATGEPLAESREMLRLAVAPREVRQPGTLRRALSNAGVAPQFVIRSTDTRRSWVVLPGRYLPSDVASAIALRGVYVEPASERVYAMPAGMRGLVGQVGAEGNPIEGMELALDSLLRGVGECALADFLQLVVHRQHDVVALARRDTGIGRRFESAAVHIAQQDRRSADAAKQ
jgi:cell division protein FtsI/penicillin-binding protein 2